MIRIDVLRKVPEDLTLHWLVGVEQDDKKGWRVRIVTCGVSSGKFAMWSVPIGLFPVLALGYRFSEGRLLPITYGEYSEAIIPNLAAGEEINSSDIPPELYSFAGKSHGVQRLLRYRVDQVEYLVPTMELIRSLFLHNKTLANHIMQPGGIMTLFRPVEPGFHPRLQLDYTQQMPVRSLKRSFILEFSWLAVDPDGQRAWDSVYERTFKQKYMTFDPPDLHDCGIKFRGVRKGNQWLILEISEFTGKRVPCDVLYFSHPSLGKTITVRMPKSQPKRRGPDGGPSSGDVPVIDTVGSGSRTDVHQPALPILTRTSIFDREIEVRRVDKKDRVRVIRRRNKGAADTSENEGKTRKYRGSGKTPPPKVSVSPESLHDDLLPMEFQVLAVEKGEGTDDLRRLMQVICTMANGLKDVRVLTALCRLETGQAFSMVGRRQRLCLVAVFFQEKTFPVVLLDMEHSNKMALSTLLLRFRRSIGLRDIENHILSILHRLDCRGGRWDVTENEGDQLAHYERLRKVMRPDPGGNEQQQNGVWAEKLKKKIFEVPGSSAST